MVWSRQAWLLFVCLLSLCQVRAIFEEQAGVIDWHKANLGQLTHAEFAFRGRERLFVGSRAGVVASLQTQDGSIVWRQVEITIPLPLITFKNLRDVISE